jgi:acetyl-CoA synthetase
MSSAQNKAAGFRAARDVLLRHRTDYDAAMREFRWPEPTEFNWALDHFDEMACGNDDIALRIVEESGKQVTRSFEQLRQGSNQAANLLRRIGIGRGDRVLVMLPNRVELWEIMLAAMKLGAVLSPATMILSEADLKDRIERGEMRGVITDNGNVERFSAIARNCQRVVVGGEADGWVAYDRALSESSAFAAQGVTRSEDPCVLYFTSGTTSLPKMVQHTHRSYPVGHLSTMYWTGLQRGDVHLNISSPGWGEARVELLLRSVRRRRAGVRLQQGRFDAGARCRRLSIME